MKKIKTLTILFTCICLAFAFLTTNQVNAQETNENVVEINNEELNYHANISTIYLDDEVYKYLITEFDDTYTLTVDKINNTFILDEIVLTNEQYLQLVQEQLHLLTSKTRSVVPSLIVLASNQYEETKNISKVYDQKHDTYTYNVENHVHEDFNPNTRCTMCPLNTTEIPTTNYSSNAIDIGVHSTNMEIAMTAGIIAAVASFLCYGMGAIASALISGVLTAIGAVSTPANLKYHGYQYTHNVCWIAIKEMRYCYVTDTLTGTQRQDVATSYFYTQRP